MLRHSTPTLSARTIHSMKPVAMLLGFSMAFSGLTSAQSPTDVSAVPAADKQVYGEYPIAYKEIITRWLATKLVDPPSAAVEWGEAPKPGEYQTQKRDTFVGYVVDFKVNARNQFGGPTGKQKYRVVIRNGDVIWGGHPRR